MLQVIQPIDGRKTEVAEVPDPACGPHQILVANAFSLVSAGTEKSTVDLARQSLLQKARSRPDQVKAVLRKARAEGVLGTIRQVRTRLSQPMPLGYSSAGIVVGVGSNVREFHVGDRVASNGCHAGVVAVGKHLAAKVPDEVPLDQACYAVVGSIALQGIRLANVGLGDVVGVIGLGLIGQICVALLKSAGCIVVGTDLAADKLELALQMGADAAVHGQAFASAIEQRTSGRGADAVLIAASTSSNAPIEKAARCCRAKGKIVAVGAVGMTIPRREFYPKELEFAVSCSYGPGRYDSDYEEKGIDYPARYVRWTAQRNVAAVLDQMASGRLNVDRLTTHRFPIDKATEAYEMIESGERPFVGILLAYPPRDRLVRRIKIADSPKAQTRWFPLSPASKGDKRPIGVSVIGAGNFAAGVLIPHFIRSGEFVPRGLISAQGLTARTIGGRYSFAFAGTSLEDALADPDTHAVAIATRHDLHTPMALAALKARKAVFLEKPLAIHADQLEEWQEVVEQLGEDCPVWTVGFNRRFSPGTTAIRKQFAGVSEPKLLTIRFNAGRLPPEHWTHDPEVGGGRIVGEVCHAIDLAAFLVGSRIVRVSTASAKEPGSSAPNEDNVSITLNHADGSVSTVIYSAGGDRAAGKERIEMFGGDRTAVLDDFRRATVHHEGRCVYRQKWWSQQKGFAEEIAAFADALRKRTYPILPTELFESAAVCLRAVQSLRMEMPLEVA